MLKYIFSLIFGIVRYKYYVVFDNGDKKQVYLNHIPDSIVLDGIYYNVLSETSELINKTMIYSWLKLERI